MNKLILLCALLFITSCTTEIPTSPTTKWGDYTFRLEARPPVIVEGMIEMLTIVNYKEKLRGWDLILYYRIGPTGKWVQAIQDGHTGVYRRAMKINDPASDVLHVHVKRNQTPEEKEKNEARKETVIEFPLDYSTAAASKSGS